MSTADGWEVVASTPVYQSPYLEVRSEKVRIPGQPGERAWTTVRRKAAIVIAPLTDAGAFLLIRQARIPVRQFLWEFPAGQVDEAGEVTPAILEATARRELIEETGRTLPEEGRLISLGAFFSSPGFTDETCHFFLAQPVHPSGSGGGPHPDEVIAEVKEFWPAELRRMVAENMIQDANTLALFARLTARGLVV
ncbi:MAG TPA: NUDIX hydrolase [Chthoniobacterales bacterium]